jgi:Uma2 family endonuclease
MSTVVREDRAAPPTAAAAPRPPGRTVYRFTADQVFRMVEAGIIPEDGTTELLDGILYEMTNGELHNAIVTVVADLLRPLVAQAAARHHIRQECSNTADPYSLPEPDVAVVQGRVFDYLPTPPTLEKLALVVEVNQSTPGDHTQKLAKYARAGIPTYWVVDAEEHRVVVYTGPRSEGGYDQRIVHRRPDFLEVSIGGQVLGTIRIEEMFPPQT